MGIDKVKERVRRWASRVERGKREPWEKEMATDKVREREMHQESHER